MDTNTNTIKRLITSKNEDEFTDLLCSGLDPNFEGGWPIRLAARYGCATIVERLLQHGANPHLLDDSGASTLQLAVFSGQHWDTDRWISLLSCCDSSQLADGAAVAVIFHNILALKKILGTGRCNTNIPTTLTGKTLEDLAKGYKLIHLLDSTCVQNYHDIATSASPRLSRQARTTGATLTPYQSHNSHRNLSPSVARFFHQTAGQTSLSPSRSPVVSASSPRAHD